MYRAGDFWRCCDVCGFDFRASQTMKRWDGLWVCQQDWEPSHPQDMVRGRADSQRVYEPRPEASDTFISGSRELLYSADGEQLFASGGIDELAATN